MSQSHSNPGGPESDADAYVGLHIDEARRLAHQNGRTRVRVFETMPDAITLEFVPDRINFVVTDGRVTYCWLN